MEKAKTVLTGCRCEKAMGSVDSSIRNPRREIREIARDIFTWLSEFRTDSGVGSTDSSSALEAMFGQSAGVLGPCLLGAPRAARAHAHAVSSRRPDLRQSSRSKLMAADPAVDLRFLKQVAIAAAETGSKVSKRRRCTSLAVGLIRKPKPLTPVDYRSDA